VDRPPDIERELAARARRGDHAAYAELVRRYEQLAFRVAWLVCRSAAEAEDAAQDGFIKAYRALARFRKDADFRPWLLQIVANEARNRVRSARRRLHYESLAAVASANAVPSAEAAAVADDRQKRLLLAVDALPEKERVVVACRYLLELTEAETAAVVGVPRGTVKSRLARAMGRLQLELAEVDDG
jgi:RNA polymerase sigma factor (sigma-70 family)